MTEKRKSCTPKQDKISVFVALMKLKHCPKNAAVKVTRQVMI